MSLGEKGSIPTCHRSDATRCRRHDTGSPFNGKEAEGKGKGGTEFESRVDQW